MKKLLLVISTALFMLSFGRAAADEGRLLRFPDINGEKVVFSYAGDIYIVNLANEAGKIGGVARKLTSNIGYEMFPKISPDGKLIAFTGQYDGNTEVYTIPVEGGEPTELHTQQHLEEMILVTEWPE